jgi:hypothetical protein
MGPWYQRDDPAVSPEMRRVCPVMLRLREVSPGERCAVVAMKGQYR